MTVSVIIPCYNVEQYIAACLRSVVGQDVVLNEIICVDDGSSDGTVAVIRALQADYPGRITLLETRHGGASAARNTGLAMATGQYIQFLDADDVLQPGKLSGQLGSVAANDSPDLVVGDYVVQHANGHREHIKSLAHAPWMGLIKTRIGSTCSNLWKRSIVLAIGGWDEGLASSQDHELIFRMLRAGGTVAYDPRALTVVDKARPGRISAVDATGNWTRYIDLRVAVRGHLRDVDSQRFSAEINAADQYLFMAMHLLAHIDLPLAVSLYHRHMPKGFVPEVSMAITRRYVIAHRLLGFERAVRLGRLLKG
jgi:glycosyltransferase involved in cell wall biosynthesis